MQLATGEQLLPGLVQLDQLVVGLDLGDEAQQLLLRAVDGQLDLFGAQRAHRAIAVERAVRAVAGNVFAVDARGVGVGLVAVGGLDEHLALDHAAIDGGAFDGNAEKLALGHDRSGSLGAAGSEAGCRRPKGRSARSSQGAHLAGARPNARA
jgi:hypothetical protein